MERAPDSLSTVESFKIADGIRKADGVGKANATTCTISGNQDRGEGQSQCLKFVLFKIQGLVSKNVN